MHELLSKTRKELEQILEDESQNPCLRANARNLLVGGEILDYSKITNAPDLLFAGPTLPFENPIRHVELVIVDFCTDNPLTNYEFFVGEKFQGLPPNGVVIDALSHSIKEDKDISNEKFYHLPRYAGSERFTAVVLEKGESRTAQTGGPSEARIRSLRTQVLTLSGRLAEDFSHLVSDFRLTNEEIQKAVIYLSQLYSSKCKTIKDDWTTGQYERTTDPYGMPWEPMFRESRIKLEKYIKFKK